MAVNIIESTGTTNTVAKHHRSDKSSQNNVIGDADTGDLLVPRFVYSKLSNFVDAKTINRDHIMLENNEYAFFMAQMEEFAATGTDVDNIAAVDEYLGKLGVDTEYPFVKDTYTTEPWVTTLTQDESRNVVDGAIDNVAVNIDGTIYNIVHRVPL